VATIEASRAIQDFNSMTVASIMVSVSFLQTRAISGNAYAGVRMMVVADTLLCFLDELIER
jgi:hypothetical protein